MFRVFIILLTLALNINAEEWRVDKDDNNSVVFYSKTTLLDFKGETDQVDGYIYLEGEGDSLFDGSNELFFEVYPAYFETGIGKRDRDMREEVLETDKYPVASFRGSIFKTTRSKNSIIVDAAGEFSLHGVTRPLKLQATVIKTEDRLKVTGNFSVLLKDYNIEAPSLMAFVKVAQEIKIEVSLNLQKVKKV